MGQHMRVFIPISTFFFVLCILLIIFFYISFWWANFSHKISKNMTYYTFTKLTWQRKREGKTLNFKCQIENKWHSKNIQVDFYETRVFGQIFKNVSGIDWCTRDRSVHLGWPYALDTSVDDNKNQTWNSYFLTAQIVCLLIEIFPIYFFNQI